MVKNKRFTGAQSAEDIRIEYERPSEPVKTFFDELCETGLDAFVPKAELWEAFYEYCKKYAIPNPFTSMIGFGKRVSKNYTGTTRKVDGKNCLVWTGIKLRHDHNYHKNDNSLPSLERSKSNKEKKEVRVSYGSYGNIKKFKEKL